MQPKEKKKPIKKEENKIVKALQLEMEQARTQNEKSNAKEEEVIY